MQPILRDATMADAEAAAALIVAAFADQPVPLDPPPSALRETPASVAAQFDAGGGLVAAYGGALVGVLIWSRREREFHVARLSVATAWRRRGIARALLAAAEAAARARGCQRMTLGTRLALAGNRALFASVGFREVSLQTHDGYAAPTWVEMEKGWQGMTLPVSRAVHDRAVRFIAANRFPFPGQTDWKPDNLTITNESEPRQPIQTAAGPRFPDIVIVSTAGEVREVAEVECEEEADWAERWQAASLAADNHTTSGARHFFVYVPEGLEQAAAQVIEDARISCAGLRSYSVAADGTIRVVPIVTGGDPKDHVVSVSGPGD